MTAIFRLLSLLLLASIQSGTQGEQLLPSLIARNSIMLIVAFAGYSLCDDQKITGNQYQVLNTFIDGPLLMSDTSTILEQFQSQIA